MNDTYLYPWGPKDARSRNEIALWRESYRANVACRQAIEDAIRQNFDGMHLSSNCLKPVLEEYGYKRTAWVLANTLHELKSDGRFSQSNKLWAEQFYIPADPDHNSDFTVRSHPAVLDGFVDLYRKSYQDIALSMQGGLIPPGPIPDELKAYHFNQRNEGIDLGDVAGALLATQNLQMQTFVTTPGASPDGSEESVAFAVNQRDEVRDLHGVAGALQEQQPMGAPTRTQRSGSCGERRRSGISELSQKCESEGCATLPGQTVSAF